MVRTIRHLIVIAAVLAGTTLAAGSAQDAAPATVTFNISVRGQRVGQENVTLSRTPDGWLISATGSQGAPANFTIDKFEARYSADWQPQSLVIEAQANQLMTLSTVFAGTTATTNLMQGGQPSATTQTVSPRTVVLPNNFFGAYEALAARLNTSTVGTTIPIYVVPQAEITGTVVSVSSQRIQTPDAIVELRHFGLSMKNPSGPVTVDVSIDAKGRLARMAVPSAGIVALRGDLSNVMTRDATYQNDADKTVFIKALGFSLAATTTAPPSVAPTEKLPAVVLIGASDSTDRDETASGVPIFGQLSGELAKAGFFVVRYDKRGVGQSGGRPESATLQDYADDALSVVSWLRERKDIDQKRIALVGRGQGAAVALIAGDRAGSKVAALALISAPGQTGREIVLAQQQRALDRSNDSADDKRAKVQLQTKILDAVVKGQGWEGVPPALQKAADTLMFKSWVEFDPAAAMKKADQPILILHGALDTEMPLQNADRLEALSLARKTKAAPLTKKVVIPGVNHLLVPATTGEVAEYASLPVKTISPAVATSLVEWLRAVMTKR
jgi:uncharacterized protein